MLSTPQGGGKDVSITWPCLSVPKWVCSSLTYQLFPSKRNRYFLLFHGPLMCMSSLSCRFASHAKESVSVAFNCRALLTCSAVCAQHPSPPPVWPRWLPLQPWSLKKPMQRKQQRTHWGISFLLSGYPNMALHCKCSNILFLYDNCVCGMPACWVAMHLLCKYVCMSVHMCVCMYACVPYLGYLLLVGMLCASVITQAIPAVAFDY